MGKYNLPSDALRTVRDLGARLARTERAPRAGNTSIDTGSFTLKAPNGTVLFYVGTLPNGDYGVAVYRDDGSLAFRVGRSFITDPNQRSVLYNRVGREIAGDQFLANEGRIDFNIFQATPATLNPQVGVTSAVFVDTHLFYIVNNSADQTFYFSAICTDGTTSGEVRLTDNSGNALTGVFGASVSPIAIPIGTTVETDFNTDTTATPWIGNQMGSLVTIRAQARRTAGVGTVNIRPKFLYQHPS